MTLTNPPTPNEVWLAETFVRHRHSGLDSPQQIRMWERDIAQLLADKRAGVLVLPPNRTDLNDPDRMDTPPRD